MKRKLLVIACLASCFGLTAGAIAAQEQSDQEEPRAESNLGLVLLDELGGFDGMAILQGGGRGTEVSIGLHTSGGFLGIGRGDPESLGQVAVLRGTCAEPESVVEEIGELTPAQMPGQQDDDEPQGFALVGSIGMGLQELQADAHVLGVLERETAEDQQEQEETINLAACGTLGEEPQQEPEPGEGGTPGAGPSPTPREPTPTPVQ